MKVLDRIRENRGTVRAAVYARFSSDNQRDESIDAQLRAINEYAKRNDIIVVAEYIDRAKSAMTDNRPEFLTMIKDAKKVFKEIFRVLKRGGRLSISDVVATEKLPKQTREDLQLVSSCIGGAEYVEDVRIMLQNTGFSDIQLTPKENSREIIKSWGFGKNIEDYVASFIIEAKKQEREEKRGGMDMKKLKIEWRHLDLKGETCERCYDTGENLANEVKRLNRILEPQGVVIELIETKLDDKQIPQSNTVLFNGVPIEDILDIEVYENYCDSCTALLGKEIYCRAVKFEGNDYDDIPAKAIRQAAYKALGITETKQETSKNSGCCSGKSGCCC